MFKYTKIALNESALTGDEIFYLEHFKNKILNNMEDEDWDAINEELCGILMSDYGQSSTVAGEVMRAINRIAYRYYNDGDMAGSGYGKETVNPAVRYLDATVTDDHDFIKAIDNIYHLVYCDKSCDDNIYENYLKLLIKTGCSYVLKHELYKVENKIDMFDYRTKDDYDDTCYDDDQYDPCYDDQYEDEYVDDFVDHE